MKALIWRYSLQIGILLLTALFVFLYPITSGASKYAAYEFWAAFGQLAVICYVLYLLLYWGFSSTARKMGWGFKMNLASHLFAFLIGYYLLFGSFSMIGGGINIL